MPFILTMRTIANLPAEFAGRRTVLMRIAGATTSERTAVWLQEARLAGVHARSRPRPSCWPRPTASTARASRSGRPRHRPRPAALSASRAPHRSLTRALHRHAGQSGPRGYPALRLGRHRPAGRSNRWRCREIIERVRHRPRVFGEWGFDARHAASRNLSVLFSGPSGTGKTMAPRSWRASSACPSTASTWPPWSASTSARRRRTSRRSSTTPRPSGAILFFDEADALFGKRSEVQRLARPLRQPRGQLPAAAHGGVRRHRHPGHQPAQQHGRRLHPPPALRGRLPVPGMPTRAEILPAHLPASHAARPTTSTCERWRGATGCRAATSATSSWPPPSWPRRRTRSSRSGTSSCAVRREHQKMGKWLVSEEAAMNQRSSANKDQRPAADAAPQPARPAPRPASGTRCSSRSATLPSAACAACSTRRWMKTPRPWTRRLRARSTPPATTAGRSTASVQQQMAPHFGPDVNDVRVHDDAEAGSMAEDLHARAFTQGRDVYFAPGQYAPESDTGTRRPGARADPRHARHRARRRGALRARQRQHPDAVRAGPALRRRRAADEPRGPGRRRKRPGRVRRLRGRRHARGRRRRRVRGDDRNGVAARRQRDDRHGADQLRRRPARVALVLRRSARRGTTSSWSTPTPASASS